MRRLKRSTLPDELIKYLDTLAQKVASAANPKTEAASLWANKNKKQFAKIRARLEAMASGLQRCVYCEDSAGTEHFRPKADYPEHAFNWDNYLIACSACNSNEKRDQFPVDDTGAPLLIDPTADEPSEHLRVNLTTGKYRPKTEKGEKSMAVFGLDRQLLTDTRCTAVTTFQIYIVCYANSIKNGETVFAARLAKDIKSLGCAAVFEEISRIAHSPLADKYLHPECILAIEAHPEIARWLD